MILGPSPSPWPPLLATRGPGSRSARHAHHAMHLVLARTGTLRVEVKGHWRSAPGAITAADVPHAIEASGEVLLVFLDPESAAGVALQTTFAPPVRLLTPADRDALWAEPLAVMLSPAWGVGAVAILGGPVLPPRRVHPRVRQALKRVAADPAGASLEALAAEVGLSAGRLMHVFTESIGVPLRPYLAWLKLQRAAAGITSGMKLGDAAHAAGFSDAAHMSRTFRQMFGVTPSTLRPRKSQPAASRN